MYGQNIPNQVPFVAPKLWTMQIPKLPTEEPFIPDLHGPNGTELEDKLSIEMIEHGYRDPPAVDKEFGNLRHFFKHRLTDVAEIRSRVGNEIDVLHWCIQARTKPTTIGDAYRPPSTSGTMNEVQKKEWMKAFVNLDLRVNTLETVPHFKIEALIKHLYEFDVPYPKALWLIKAIFRDTRSMQQKDDFAQGMTDSIRTLTQVLYAPSSSFAPTSSSSYSHYPSQQAPTRNPPNANSSSSNHTHSANNRYGASSQPEPSLSASSSNLSNSMHIAFPKIPNQSSSLSPEQQAAKTNLMYVIKLLGWTYRDGFIPLDIVLGGMVADFSNCIDSVACVYLSIIFQFLPDILINYPALEKLKAILQQLADKFALTRTGKDGWASLNPGPESKLFSLYCSTLKVLVAYLPDFLDTHSLEVLRRYMVSVYNASPSSISNSLLNAVGSAIGSGSGAVESSPGGTVTTPFSSGAGLHGSSMMHSSNASVANSHHQHHQHHHHHHSGGGGVKPSTGQALQAGGLAAINPYNLTSTQLSALHLLYQNINANRTSLLVDSACYDQICNLLATNTRERALSLASGAALAQHSRPSDHWNPMSALNALDSFVRHLDMDELFQSLFLRGAASNATGIASHTPGSLVSTPGGVYTPTAATSGLKLSPLLPAHESNPSSSSSATLSSWSSACVISGETLEKTIALICTWAISPFRSGVHRIFVASSLLRRFLAQHPHAPDSIYDILINFMDDPPSFKMDHDSTIIEGGKETNKSGAMEVDPPALPDDFNEETVAQVSMLMGELIRNKAFSHDKYLRRLISRGLLQQKSHELSSTAMKHRAYLMNIPLFGDCKHDRIQRNLTIHRYLPESQEMRELDEGILLVNQSLLCPSPAFSSDMDLSDTNVSDGQSEGNDAFQQDSSNSGASGPSHVPKKAASRAESEKRLYIHLDRTSLFCKSGTGQYALTAVKWLLTAHYGGVHPNTERRPVGLDETLTLSQLECDQIELLQKLCVLLERISDFRSMVELARWLLDRALHWNVGAQVLSQGVIPLCKAYEHVLLALDVPLASFLERLLILSQRWKSYPYNSPTAFLVKFVAKHAPNLKTVQAWANEKTLSLEALRQALLQKPGVAIKAVVSKPALKIVTSAQAAAEPKPDPQIVLADAFVAQIAFEPSSLLLRLIPLTTAQLPFSFTTPSAALSVLQRATQLWLTQLTTISGSNDSPAAALPIASVSQVERVCGVCGSERSLQHALSQCFAAMAPSAIRNLLFTLATQEPLRHLLTTFKGSELALSIWFDSLCTCLRLSGELILSLVTKIMTFVVANFASLDSAYVTFILRLMATLAHFSFQPRDQQPKTLTPNRWLHTLGRPIKKQSLQSFVSFCNLVVSETQSNSDSKDRLPMLTLIMRDSEAKSESYDAASLLWFLGESLLNLPPDDLSSIFKSMGDPLKAFHVCSIIFHRHGLLLLSKMRSHLPSLLSHTLPSSQEAVHSMALLQQNPLSLCDSALMETTVKTILANTHLWSVRFTSLQLQLLLDAANEIEKKQNQETMPEEAQNAMETSKASPPMSSASSPMRINEIFAATLMQKLAVMMMWQKYETMESDLPIGLADFSLAKNQDGRNMDAIMSLLRRLGASVRFDLVTYIFKLLEPSKASTRYHLTASLLSANIDLEELVNKTTGMSPSKIERSLVELLLSAISCCLDAQLAFPIDQVLEPHINYIDVHVIPHLNDFSKWREIRTQLYIRLSLIRWVLPSDPDAPIAGSHIATPSGGAGGGAATTAASNAGGANSQTALKLVNGVLDRLTVLLLRLLAAPVLQENVLDGKDLWTLALHSFAALKSHQKQATTRRAIAELYPTLTMPAHLRVRLEPVLQSAARKDRAIYLNNGSRVILPKGIDATRQLEEQPEPSLLHTFGARKVPMRPLTYANHLLSSRMSQSNATPRAADPPPSSMRQKRPGDYDHPARSAPPQPR
jgi:hypothetical protein